MYQHQGNSQSGPVQVNQLRSGYQLITDYAIRAARENSRNSMSLAREQARMLRKVIREAEKQMLGADSARMEWLDLQMQTMEDEL
ncbi:hypothetical protein FVEN_g12680 [Fusarium venenatum]|uniref:Uncharacterized protein n=1 Tax=Fusarium venenatum TaxID=56646 RepID=A0A2L2SRT2_9HYPO|nr:uncharacterized protein FVRRES_12611 [Fusarium venenatum]KAG8360549.1 hypothetical protein FVEN_g12680 [Fusarium venenatum]CEI39920.1 unnamed protein product [Fusarium venenatum]